MKKPVAAKKGAKGSEGRCPDEGLAKKYPNVVEHLATTRWDDGTARERSTLTVFIEDGTVKVALNDREQGQSLYVAGEGLQAALEVLERALAEEKGDWRAWKGKRR